MKKIYRIKLSAGERRPLEKLSRSQTAAAHKVTKTGIGSATLDQLRKRCCEVGPLEAMERKAQQNRAHKFTGEVEAQLVKLACSEPPERCVRWTLQLLADKLIELKVVDYITD